MYSKHDMTHPLEIICHLTPIWLMKTHFRKLSICSSTGRQNIYSPLYETWIYLYVDIILWHKDIIIKIL